MRMIRIRKPGRPSGMSIRKCRRERETTETKTTTSCKFRIFGPVWSCHAHRHHSHLYLLIARHSMRCCWKPMKQSFPRRFLGKNYLWSATAEVKFWCTCVFTVLCFLSSLTCPCWHLQLWSFSFVKVSRYTKLQEDSGSPASPTSLPGVEAPCFKGNKHESCHDMFIISGKEQSNIACLFQTIQMHFARIVWLEIPIKAAVSGLTNHMNKTKSKTASAASLNVPDDAEMRVTWQNRRWEKDFSTTVFQVLCFHPSWVVESISWTRSWPSQKIVHFRSREMFGSVHTSYGSWIFHAFVLGLIHKELQDPGQSPWITAEIWWKNPGLFCKVKWRVKRFTKIHKDLEQIIEKSSSLVCRIFFQHSHCLLCFTCPVWTWDAQRWNNRKYGWSNWSRSLALLFLVRVNTGDCRRCRSNGRQGGMVLGCTHFYTLYTYAHSMLNWSHWGLTGFCTSATWRVGPSRR